MSNQWDKVTAAFKDNNPLTAEQQVDLFLAYIKIFTDASPEDFDAYCNGGKSQARKKQVQK